ncbi:MULTISPECIES: hypothetical protein [unclassified Lysobacter]|uniref:hypothetical protein n=1 Tax=unclassified Lysobacter TaxID=2635362 RepID=UPI000710FB60|nr:MULTISPECIES: hypothetical protein [unclassified Lysobacter]KRD39424.1 hypothetical protein ASE35_03440 [Lysobacter sp. Root916]KRD79394.1 hypothetical protein ASE43_00220 [Lysobacter sp. Root983]
MEKQDLELFAVQLMGVAKMFEVVCDKATERFTQSATELKRTADVWETNAQLLTRDLVASVGEQTRDAIELGVGAASAQYGQQLQNTAAALREVSRNAEKTLQQLDDQRRELKREQKSLIWTGLIGLGLGALLAASGAGYLIWQSGREVKRAEFASDILRATKSGALSRCGQALCARVDANAKRYGPKGEYLLLEQ